MFASDAAARSEFGISLVLKGRVAVLGAIGGGVNGDNSGAAYVFEQREGQWAQTARLQPIDAGPRQWFGFSVALSDEAIVVGAPTHSGSGQRAGAAYVFERRAGVWSQTARLTASDVSPGMGFGHSVAISGDTIVAGVHVNEDGTHPGAAYVFERTGGSWSEVARLRQRD